MRARLVVVASLSVAVWATIFFGTAYVIVRLVERIDGEQSECHGVNCGTFGNFLHNHDLLATLMLAVFALIPATGIGWAVHRYFANLS